MPSPRVWSRDDFLKAMKLVSVRHTPGQKDEARWWAESACAVLEFAESNAVLHVDQGRDERGRFLPKPQLHADSPLVIQARAG
jgi:hypothetical protein